MRDVLLARWSELADKIVTLADALPDAQYSFRPSADVRSFADQLRHVAFWNQYAGRTLRREAADGAANELAPNSYPTKAKILPALRQSFDDVTTHLKKENGALEQGDVDTVVSFIEHNGEHYGQLVLYLRLNGIVPPASR